MKKIGLDIGSTTLKAVVVGEDDSLIFSSYERHFSRVSETVAARLGEIRREFGLNEALIAVSGSAGMGVAETLGLPFVQEVYAEKLAVGFFRSETDVVIELGGEDAKILFLTNGFEMRMNGSCAGGTGAFIDQMATLMKLTVDDLNKLSENHDDVCAIASRCGVFAKSDIQPLLNQGVRKENIAAGIFRAVADQTIAGLAQGRKIVGNVLYLGGPLTFLSELRKAFDDILGIKGECPDNSLYYVAIGAARSKVAEKRNLAEVSEAFEKTSSFGKYESCRSLFRSEEEYAEFRRRHENNSKGIRILDKPGKENYLGIDAGSTTLKIVLADGNGNIFRPFYTSSRGNPVELVKDYLSGIYADYPDIDIVSSAVTGYGEELVRNAFGVDFGVVETIAHYTAAKKFCPSVDFILDIGGQDIKCFKIRNGAIEYLYLNEACSSGCGSFLQTFAEALGYSAEEFSRIGLFADAPVNLGSRCTVFMNSSVKQAQKDGASTANISAGLSISVVKNALYKVIRCTRPEELGNCVVVQGGAFLSDCVLRAFEQETGKEVIRTEFSALMGAYGAALFAKENCGFRISTLITPDKLVDFTHTVRSFRCGGCGNGCILTVNTFSGGGKYIAGNRCSKPLGIKKAEDPMDIYAFKLKLLSEYMNPTPEKGKINIGLPMGLNMYELLPFWATFFKELGFGVVTSPFSDRKIYSEGQYSIPSDTACYPAKLMHGHAEYLLKRKVNAIFYPCSSYNVDEGRGVDHFNCPIVAYYPKVLLLNVDDLRETDFISDFVSIYDKKTFVKRMSAILSAHFLSSSFGAKSIACAADKAYSAYDGFLRAIESRSAEFLERAIREKKPIIVLVGRPYHVDPVINHGIHELITRLGAVVISEDGIPRRKIKQSVGVRNQWTYHARLYSAAEFVADASDDVNISLVQLVSFGCGLDAVTTDEVRSIVEKGGKLYAQIKIDEISNMGAVTIRMRSLLSVMERKRAVSPESRKFNVFTDSDARKEASS